VLFLEAIIETLRDFLNVEACTRADGNVDKCEIFFLSKVERDVPELLNQRFASLAAIEVMFASGCWFPRLAFHPLPNLPRLRSVGEDNEMFVCGISDLPLDFATQIVIGQRAVALANERGHPALLGDGG
jgi:hypothetical protein